LRFQILIWHESSQLTMYLFETSLMEWTNWLEMHHT
jgi:hypothetical protein